MRSLHAEKLINEPQKLLPAVNDFLELGISNELLNEIAFGNLSTQDAKDINKSFSVSKRDENYQRVESFFGTDLSNGFKWLTANNPSTSLTPNLSCPLD